MKQFFVPFSSETDSESGLLVLTAKSKTTAKDFAFAEGATLDDAREQLKAMVLGSMASMASHAEDPLRLLHFGKPPLEAALFTGKELLPLLLTFKRTSMGLTQADVAGMLGISQPAYAKYEKFNANPRMATVEQLGQVLGEPLLIPADIASRVA